jgi:WD40 repeat protein/energy-coupling factor transporter ATP-binding protein EcfA2
MMSENSTQVSTEGDVLGVAGTNAGTVNITYISQTNSEAQIQDRKLIKGSPYLGLRKFEVDDKDKFFGRDKWIIELTNYLAKENVLLLLGASGSGKSSLIQAGLIPKLKDQWGSQLFNFTFVPDVDPFESFYGCLLTKYKQSEAKLARTVKEDTLIQVVQALKSDAQWLIFIDQFEEVFIRTPKTERDIFIKNLIKLIENSDSSVKVIMTMRADFLDKLSPYPDLGKVHDSSSRMLTDMEDSDLRLAIAEPAARNGVIFEQGLIDTIIADFKQQAGSLPLLQYTLNLLWSKDDITDRVLNTKTYQELGGVTGALQQQANKIYDQFDETQRKLAEEIFLELIELVGKEAVSRRADKGIFERDETQKEVLYQLIDNRLLVSKGEDGKATVEVAHEALLRSWPVLQNLIREKEEVIVLKNRLDADARNWQDAQKASSELWSGSKLGRVMDLLFVEQALVNLDALAIEFICASVTQSERQRNEKIRTARRIALGSLVAVVAIGIAGINALWQSKIADLRATAADIKVLLHTQPVAALVKAIQATGESKNVLWQVLPEVQSSLYEAIDIAKERDFTNELESFFSMTGMIFGNDPIGSIAINNEKQYIVIGLRAGLVGLFDEQGLPIEKFFEGIGKNTKDIHQGVVTSVAISPDGSYVVSGSEDKTIKLWNKEGKVIQQLNGHSGHVTAVAISANGQYILSGSQDKTIRLWTKNGKLLQEMKGHNDTVKSVAFSSDGQYIVSGSTDKTVRLWNKQGSPISKPFQAHELGVMSVAVSPDGQYIVSGSEDKTVRLWNKQGNPVGLPFKGHERTVTSVAFSPDGQYIVSGSEDGTVRLWDKDGNPIGNPLKGHYGFIKIVTFSADGQSVISGSEDKTIRFWDKEGHNIGLPFKGHTHYVLSVAFSPDGQQIVSAGRDDILRLWTKDGKPIWKRKGHEEFKFLDRIDRLKFFTSIAFSPDGQYIASVSNDGMLWLWDKKGDLIKKFKDNKDSYLGDVRSVAFSSDSKYILSGHGFSQGIRLWDVQGGNLIREFKNQQISGNIESVAFSPDGKYILSSGSNIQFWDIEGNLIWQSPFIQDGDNLSAAFSPDGQFIVSGGSHGILRLWDKNGNPIGKPFSRQEGNITSVAFSPDGKYIVSGSQDNTVRLWEKNGRNPIVTINAHDRYVNSVAFSPDGQYIVSGGDEGTIRLWRGGNWQDWLKIGCKRLRNHPAFLGTTLIGISEQEASDAVNTCLKYGGWSESEKTVFRQKREK